LGLKKCEELLCFRPLENNLSEDRPKIHVKSYNLYVIIIIILFNYISAINGYGMRVRGRKRFLLPIPAHHLPTKTSYIL